MIQRQSLGIGIGLSIVATLLLLGSNGVHAEESSMDNPATNLNTGSGNASGTLLNPATSVDGLFTFTQFNNGTPLHFEGGHDPYQNGFNLQQVELTFGANVDPYFRGDANIVLNHEGGIEIEEAYATTMGLPFNLQAKAGNFFTAFGRHNPTHPHAWSFANKPLVLGRFFGGDGLRSTGAQVSWLTPLPFFSEIIVSSQNSNVETAPSFLGATYTPPGGTETAQTMRSLKDAVTLLRSNNFISITDELLFNFGASYLNGRNPQTEHSRTRIYGGDIYLKYRPLDSLSFIGLTVEAVRRSYDTTGPTANDWGWYAELAYRLPEGWERWHVGLRYDWVSATDNPVVTSPLDGAGPIDPTTGNPTNNGDVGKRWRISPVVTFYPSEFSKLRLQYDYDKAPVFAYAQQAVSLELEFLMGAHGAHKF
jgi:hypothetical protein